MTALSYRYKALDRSGAGRTGSVPASNPQEAFRRLASLGLTPVSLTPETRTSRRRRPRSKARDIAHFTQQLAVLINARIPVSDALMNIAEQERDPALRQVIADMAAKIEAGEPLAAAVAAHADAFGEVYVQTLRAAEKSGNLVKVLEHLAEMLEKHAETSRQWRSAFLYPICVVAVLVAAVVFLVGFVIPNFASIFASRGVALPALTRVLMTVGQSMQAWWFIYLAAAAAGVFALRRAWRSPSGRLAIDRLLHRIPVAREILVGAAISRFARVLGLTLGSGLPLTDCLELAGRASGRPMLALEIDSLIANVSRGMRLAEGFRSCSYLTTFTRRMLAAGEESAELTRMCGVVARHYEQETTYLARTLSTVIEPLLVVAIALVVLVVALAVFLPLWDMINLVQ